MKRGDTVNLERDKAKVWIPRTPEEMNALREADARAGRWCDEGGEPILYGPYTGWPEGAEVLGVEVTKTRKITWTHYACNKPKNLVEGRVIMVMGLVSGNELPSVLERTILFQRPE